MKVQYKGKTIDTIFFDGNLDKEKIEKIRKEYYQEDKQKALKELEGILLHNKMRTTFIYQYYFERIAADTVLHHSKYSINELLASDELVQAIINKSEAFELFKSDSLIRSFKTTIRLGGAGFAAKPTNFPLKEAVIMLRENVEGSLFNKVYIDPCCGWGIRMLAAAILDMKYIGFDVNSNLCEKLNELGEDIQKIKKHFQFKIYEQGSQYYVEDLKDKAHVIFTSPPYFNLEDYGNRDYEKEDSLTGTDYKDWERLFVYPLMKNLKEYIKPNGKILINVKDFKGYKLLESFREAGEDAGLISLEDQDMKNIIRVGYSKEGNQRIDNSETVLVFTRD